jgi:DNA repair protein RecN (Recombination protein N)
MLQNLHVKNLALIDEADVEFTDGLNILTGETGAGKSIILGSMNLALGEKVPKEMLRDNGETALVELIFHVESEKTKAALAALDIEPEDDMVILSRKISAQRAVGRINGETVSVSRMKEAAALLIDICGQQESHLLLSKRKHLEILDDYAKSLIQEKKEALAKAYREYRKLKEEWSNASLDTEEQKRELSFLEYEVNEITEANLVIGEDEELEQEYRRFSNGKKIMEGVSAAYAATGEDAESASELIGRAVRELGMVSSYDRKVEELEQQLAEIDSLLSDFNHEISSYLSDTEFDDETFYEMEKRLDRINHLKSKYGATIEAILSACEEKSARIAKLMDYDAYLSGLAENIQKQEQIVDRLSEELSGIRQKQAKKLCSAIADALKELNFLDVRFEMRFARTSDYTANGVDDAEFWIATNPGEAQKPLGKVASGGELSRIMLAIRTVMAEGDDTDTLIFDEIDSGISGRTAQMVSEKMNTLGRSHQIICITHLPQIAAMADTHFLIEKSVEHQSTVSKIRRLDDGECVSELARMLGGVEITDTVYQNAREMREMAHSKKQ